MLEKMFSVPPQFIFIFVCCAVSKINFLKGQLFIFYGFFFQPINICGLQSQKVLNYKQANDFPYDNYFF